MNSLWLSNIEILFEERRADFRREIEHLNLIREAEDASGAHQNLIKHSIHALGAWMVHHGQRLQDRYRARAPLPRYYQSNSLAR